MQRNLSLVLALAPLILPLVAPRAARAQAVQTRILEGLDVERDGTEFALRIRFTIPVFYLRHSPRDSGDSVNIQLAPLAIPSDAESTGLRRESLQVPPDFPIPLDAVSLSLDGGAEPVVELEFARSLRFQVEQGKDLRSLVVRLPSQGLQRGATAPPTPPPVLPPPPSPSGEPSRSAELMHEARRALTAAEYDRAVALLTKILALPESPQSRDARELLALARERKGQLAHAKAEYEEYLRRYPDGDESERVRQRLEALVTARATPEEQPRRRRPEHRPFDLQTFGSLYVGYRYSRLRSDLVGDRATDSSLFTDIFVDSRLQMESWWFRSQASGGYRRQFLDGGSGETRVNSLFVEAEEPDVGFAGSIGRRSKSTGGVLGRYDGVELGYRVGELWGLGFVAGLPVDSSTEWFEEFDRYFGGLSVQIGTLFDVLDLELFAVGQADGSFVDRAAVGSEVRYFDVGRTLAAFLDYDVYHQSLNTAQIVGSWQATPSTYLSIFLDHRNVPTLTTRNALQGQAERDLDGLLTLFSRDEIEELAEDRTARATNLSFSASQLLTGRLQLALDFSANHLSGTETSGGVEGMEGTGFEFTYSTRLIANDVLTRGDVGVVGLRYFDGSRADVIGAALSGRFPVTSALRLTPRIRTDYRKETVGSDTLALGSALRFDYRIWKLTFDSELGCDWNLPFESAADDQLDYFVTFGIRQDF